MNLALGVFALMTLTWCHVRTKSNLKAMIRDESPKEDIKRVKLSLYGLTAIIIMQVLNVASMVIWR